MNGISRGLLALSSLLLISLYFLPLWKIELWAPQYPEGLRMFIYINTIKGGTPYDLQNINLLNHYIGMKEINPETILDLKILPFVFVFLILYGFIGAILNKKFFLYSFPILILIVGIVELISFYRWGYEYGHNLDPNAPIKIPGMAYQPPLIGQKQVLNFVAKSYPDIGVYIAILLVIICIFAIFLDKRKTLLKFNVWGLIVPFIFIISCNKGPQPIIEGKDVCHYCKMVIMDSRFGSEIITKKNRVYKFDDIGCLISYYKEHKNEVKEVYVFDYNTKEFIKAESAYFVISESIRTPMGSSTIAFKNKDYAIKFSENILDWYKLIK